MASAAAQRLRELEAVGIVERVEKPPPVAATLYTLTEMGAALEPAIMELGRWGSRFMDKPGPADTVNIGWGLLSLKRRYRGGLDLVAELRIGDRFFELALSPGYMRVSERPSERSDVVVTGSLDAFRRLLFGRVSARQLITKGALSTSDRKRFDELASAFEGIVR